jgi:IS30 family transposase
MAILWLQVDKWSPELISVRGKNHQSTLLAITKNAKLYAHFHTLPKKNSHSVSQSIRSILQNETYHLHKLTFDNDKAFAGHRAIRLALGLETYFTRPCTSQDKETVEN